MKRRLYRSKNERMLSGVAGGIAEYYDVDPVLVRLAFVLLLFLNGIGLLIYIAAIFLVPVKPIHSSYNEQADNSAEVNAEETSAAVNNEEKPKNGKMIFGSILIIIGTMLLVDDIFPAFDFSDVFPFILILMGGWLLYPYLSAKKELNS